MASEATASLTLGSWSPGLRGSADCRVGCSPNGLIWCPAGPIRHRCGKLAAGPSVDQTRLSDGRAVVTGGQPSNPHQVCRDSAAGLVDDAVARGVVPGAVLTAGIGTAQPVLLHVAGFAQADSQARRPMTRDTVFDLASLTKVVGTLPCVLRLIAAGQLSLDSPVHRYLPAFDGPGKDAVTVRQLLTHTSGLPDHRRYDGYLHDPARVRAAALAEPLAAAAGTRVCYSDVGFIVLGELCAAVAGCGLDQLVLELVCMPLAMTETGYLPGAMLAGRTASTEPVGGVAKTGVVHDENAEVLGGVAGHAGLFGTAADLGRYAAAWVTGDSGLATPLALPGWLRAEALRCQTERIPGNPLREAGRPPGAALAPRATPEALRDRRGLGWGLRGDRWDNMGDGWPWSGAGHTGFTGTSLSVDPVSGLWAVLLTNAVHFGRGPGHSVVALRKQVHRAVAAKLLGDLRPPEDAAHPGGAVGQ
jgi:CubicO group peptidase (beta-lactamase class C family)